MGKILSAIEGDTVAFTGRRPKDLVGYNKQSYEPFMSDLRVLVFELYCHGIRRFITGGAQGFDQLVFWAVYWLRKQYPDVENIVYVPFKHQPNRWLDSGLFSKHEYELMMKHKTSHKVIVPNCPMQQWAMVRAYEERNHQMVNDSNGLIGLYPDDQWRYNKGGTAECLRYAEIVNCPTLLLRYNITNDILRATALERMGA